MTSSANVLVQVITLAALGSVYPPAAFSQALVTLAPETATAAAAKSLGTFRSISGSGSHALSLGLDAPGEASKASVGEAVVDYMIGLNPLRDWDGADAMALLRPTGQFVYPITIDGETKSSVTIAQVKGEWVAAAFGSPTEAKARSSVKDSQSQGPGASKEYAQVRIPALRATFLASQGPGGLEFTPLTSRPEVGLIAGQPASATEVLRRLQPIAKRIDPDVPN